MFRARRGGLVSSGALLLLPAQYRVHAHAGRQAPAPGRRRADPFCDVPVPGAEAAAVRAAGSVEDVLR